MALIAHAGHTLVTIAYFLPVLAFLGWLAYVTIRDRLGHRGSEDPNRGRPSA